MTTSSIILKIGEPTMLIYLILTSPQEWLIPHPEMLLVWATWTYLQCQQKLLFLCRILHIGAPSIECLSPPSTT